MGKPTDLNIVNMDSGKFAAILGDAHEHIVIGKLIRLGIVAAKVDVSVGAYDILINACIKPNSFVYLRGQVKTIGNNNSIHLGAGTRGGVDRTYKSGVKTYTYTTEHNDVIIGVDSETLDLYILPTQISEKKFNSSVSKNKLRVFKNNWNIFLNWNSDYFDYLNCLDCYINHINNLINSIND